MHVSNINLLTDEDEIFDFITRFSFATIVTASPSEVERQIADYMKKEE